jgi:hypothetical protein
MAQHLATITFTVHARFAENHDRGQPMTTPKRRNPLIGKTIKSLMRTKDSDMAHLEIYFTDGTSATFTAHAPDPEWDEPAYWANGNAKTVKLSAKEPRP